MYIYCFYLTNKKIDISTDFWQIQISKLEKETRQHCSTQMLISISVEKHIEFVEFNNDVYLLLLPKEKNKNIDISTDFW